MQGFCGWFIPCFTIMSDVAPIGIRAMGISVIVVTTEAGIPVAPILASLYGNTVAIGISLIFCFLGLLVATLFLPETLSAENKKRAIDKMEEEMQNSTNIFKSLFRPMRDLTIFNRNYCLRLIAVVYLASETMKSGEKVLFLFYAEGQIGFNAQDTALYVFIKAFAGILSQLFLLNWCVQRLGERKTVIVALTIGSLYSFLYGFTSNKILIFVVTFFASGAGMCFPTTNSIMTFNVEKHEQGTAQGAFLALQAVANAVGPVILNFIFQQTSTGAFLGASSFFYVGALVYVFANLAAIALPPDQSNSAKIQSRSGTLAALLSEDIGENDVI